MVVSAIEKKQSQEEGSGALVGWGGRHLNGWLEKVSVGREQISRDLKVKEQTMQKYRTQHSNLKEHPMPKP